jgi:ketosteroid isomerase-like protein
VAIFLIHAKYRPPTGLQTVVNLSFLPKYRLQEAIFNAFNLIFDLLFFKFSFFSIIFVLRISQKIKTMKLTKKIEAEILKTYNNYWENYLNGNVEAMPPLLADEYTQVGSAESEVFSNKKDAVQFLYDTIDQVAGKLEMRNRKTTLEQQDNSILIHEFCDLYALTNNNWVFYSKFRASTFMQQKKDGWKFTHQHSSFPDTKTEDGQNIAIDKIAEENQQLREAVKRRTIELEQKNRDLEIEGALEKVRSRSLAMQKSTELKEVANIVFRQLKDMNIETATASIYLLSEQNTDVNIWIGMESDNDYSTVSIHLQVTDNPFTAGLNDVIKSRKTLTARTLNYEEKNKLWSYLFEHSDFKIIPDERKKFILDSEAYTSSIALLKNTGIQINRYSNKSFSEKENEILQQFAKVFEQAYTRFLDLQKSRTSQTRFNSNSN